MLARCELRKEIGPITASGVGFCALQRSESRFVGTCDSSVDGRLQPTHTQKRCSPSLRYTASYGLAKRVPMSDVWKTTIVPD
eukprot:11667281-Alexandrium_andersonii.AAC.1